MSWYPNNFASYAGGGHPVNFFEDPEKNYRFNVVLAQHHAERHGYNNDNHHHHYSSRSHRSSERPVSFEEYRRDYYERQSAGDNYHNSMELSNYSPWEEDGWVPLTKSGKQKSPNQIRNELQRYIDQCKANGTSNQTRIIEQMGVNPNSFRKFMDPSTYVNQWNATTNGTYWEASKLLAKVAYEKELAKATGSGSKRKSTRDDYDSDDYDVQAVTKRYKSNSGEIKKTHAEVQLEALTLLRTITSVEGVPDGIVYDSCPELVKKIKAFLARDGMTKSNFMLALGGLNSNSLNTFLAGKRQDQAGNVTYRRAYVFFEKLRILEGKSKSSARIGNEIEHPYGFSLEKP
eukprot:scaffold39087_cov174-Skeletonema_marinoi.AAC.5